MWDPPKAKASITFTNRLAVIIDIISNKKVHKGWLYTYIGIKGLLYPIIRYIIPNHKDDFLLGFNRSIQYLQDHKHVIKLRIVFLLRLRSLRHSILSKWRLERSHIRIFSHPMAYTNRLGPSGTWDNIKTPVWSRNSVEMSSCLVNAVYIPDITMIFGLKNSASDPARLQCFTLCRSKLDTQMGEDTTIHYSQKTKSCISARNDYI